MQLTTTHLVIGRGELYFGRFLPGTTQSEGELYLGNTPGFTVSRDVEEIERFTSYGGQQVKLESHVVRESNSANITTDHASMENLALWFGGAVDDDGQAAVGFRTETFVVKPGRYYQLGTSYEPFGVRHVEPDLTFKLNGTAFTALEGNITLQRAEGRFYVMPDAPDIDDADEIEVTFQWRNSLSSNAEPVSQEVVGCLRYISTNPLGSRKNYFFPCVRIRPSGGMDLKGDQFQQLMFSADIRRLNPTTNFFYVLETARPELTEDEIAIIELGPITLEAFPPLEDPLDQIINVFIPDADYGAPITFP